LPAYAPQGSGTTTSSAPWRNSSLSPDERAALVAKKDDAGESKEVTIEIDPWYLSIFNVDRDAWQLLPGQYTCLVGGSSRSLPLQAYVNLK
jgi:hypothetical protein